LGKLDKYKISPWITKASFQRRSVAGRAKSGKKTNPGPRFFFFFLFFLFFFFFFFYFSQSGRVIMSRFFFSFVFLLFFSFFFFYFVLFRGAENLTAPQRAQNRGGWPRGGGHKSPAAFFGGIEGGWEEDESQDPRPQGAAGGPVRANRQRQTAGWVRPSRKKKSGSSWPKNLARRSLVLFPCLFSGPARGRNDS